MVKEITLCWKFSRRIAFRLWLVEALEGAGGAPYPLAVAGPGWVRPTKTLSANTSVREDRMIRMPSPDRAGRGKPSAAVTSAIEPTSPENWHSGTSTRLDRCVTGSGATRPARGAPGSGRDLFLILDQEINGSNPLAPNGSVRGGDDGRGELMRVVGRGGEYEHAGVVRGRGGKVED